MNLEQHWTHQSAGTSRPLNILHTESACGLGGQELYIHRHMQCMRARGHTVSLLCQPNARLGELALNTGFKVYRLPMGGARRLLQGIQTAYGLMRRERFDVVNTTSRRDTLITAAAARLAQVPLVVRSRHLMSHVNSLLTYTVLPHRIITVSDFVGMLLTARGIPGAKIGIVPPVAPTPEWLDAPISDPWERLQQIRAEVRAALGFDAQDTVVGCVAVLREAKGHRALLEAIAPLCRDNPRLHLLIVGDGEPVMQTLLVRRQSLQLQSQIHLLGYRTDAARLISGMDVFALATHKEAAGIVFLEAAQAGVPIVATRVGGVPEMLVEDGNALLVPLGDGPALTNALRSLLTDAVRRRRMGRAGWDWIRENRKFTEESHAEATEHYYHQWLKELGRWPVPLPSPS